VALPAKLALRLAAQLLSRPAPGTTTATAARAPVPTRGRARGAAALLHVGLAFSLLASAALLLGALAIETDVRWALWTQTGVGIAMILEGALLCTDWRGARGLLLWRLQRKHLPSAPVGLGARLGWRLASPLLQLLGLLWLAAGTLTALLGAQQLA
jgi:hypothetical protein